jgi:thiamine monophosphate synthase
MLREPAMEARALLASARWCQAQFPALPLWVSGRLDVALTAGCGLHAPEAYPDDLGDLVPLSRPLHAEAQFRERSHLDQLLIAPVFAVPGKGPPWGIERLQAFLNDCLPTGPRLLALGGVTPVRMKEFRHPRLAGVALIRALWEAQDPAALVQQLREAWAG